MTDGFCLPIRLIHKWLLFFSSRLLQCQQDTIDNQSRILRILQRQKRGRFIDLNVASRWKIDALEIAEFDIRLSSLFHHV